MIWGGRMILMMRRMRFEVWGERCEMGSRGHQSSILPSITDM